jgi:hypothetical protein
MGNQKVPRMVVLHCNGRTYGNAFLITFEVGPLRAHTLAPSILPRLEAPADGFFWTLPDFGRRILFDVPHSCETCPFGAYLRVGTSHKSLGARSREYDGWVMTQQATCGSVRNRDAETTVHSCHLSRRSSAELARRND